MNAYKKVRMWNDMSSELEQVERELTFMEDRGLQERPKYKQKESEK